MRIRKNAKLSSILGLSSPSHVCQLNQSPWDVIPFTSHDPFSPSSFFDLPDGDDNLTGNASFGDSLGAVDCGIEMAVDDEDCDIRSWKQDEAPDDNEDNNNNDNGDDNYNYRDGNTDERATRGLGICKRTNGKGKQCSREAKGGQYLCEQHLLKPHHNTSINSRIESPASSTRKGRRGRPPKRGSSAKSPGANNSNQFYYYSGFGPSWGRRRTERGGSIGGDREQSMMETGGESSGRSSATPPPPSGRIIGEEADYTVVYDIDDYDEDEESSGGDRKRTRKPVKARSLKSLM